MSLNVLGKFSHCYSSCFATFPNGMSYFMPFGTAGSAYHIPSVEVEAKLVGGIVIFCMISLPLILAVGVLLIANRIFDVALMPWLAIAGLGLVIWAAAFLVWVRMSCKNLTKVPKS